MTKTVPVTIKVADAPQVVAVLAAADALAGWAKWMRESLPFQAPETHAAHWQKLNRLYDAYYAAKAGA